MIVYIVMPSFNKVVDQVNLCHAEYGTLETKISKQI